MRVQSTHRIRLADQDTEVQLRLDQANMRWFGPKLGSTNPGAEKRPRNTSSSLKNRRHSVTRSL